MTKFAYASVGKTYYVNGTLVSMTGTESVVLVNGTLLQLRIHEPYKDSQLNELLYVIIVIVFYATALMTLIITQIKRQRREGTEVDYYDEYLQRNSEVKRTCQQATTIVTKPPTNTQSQRVTAALASAAVAAASAGSILGSHQEEPSASSALLTEEKETTDIPTTTTGRSGECFKGKGRVYSGGLGASSSGASISGSGGTAVTLFTGPNVAVLPSFVNTRTVLSRERSPTRVLESIPDEGVEE